ncbi:MAG: hypothetical protein U1F47_10655 [Hyphomicrobiales bacterium]
MKPVAGSLPVLLLWGLPLVAGIVLALGDVTPAALSAILDHPQAMPGLALSLWTGGLSTVVALAVALLVAASLHARQAWPRLQLPLSASLAVPHLAFAIGFGFLVMPSGFLARLLAGGETPPPWTTVQDPLGLCLALALVLKEVPFFLIMIWSVLARGDAAVALAGEWRAARSLGHAPGSVWLRVVQPQLLKRLAWPMAAVFAYGASVVDMSLVLGPTQPPTLAVLVWRDLNDADAAINARGSAGAAMLTLSIAAVLLAATASSRLRAKARARWRSRGPSRLGIPYRTAVLLLAGLALTYGLVLATLAVLSVAARWTYPVLWPDTVRWTAWGAALADTDPLLLSLALAATTTAVALGCCVLWFETQPNHRDSWLTATALAALALPQLLVAAGQYRGLLALDLAGSFLGLAAVHLTPVLAYVVLVLAGPYRALDPRYASAARTLGTAPLRRWLRITAPLLRAPLLMAAAVGFTVSLVQFVPAQLAAAGRHTTLPMAAVTLASGGNRTLTAAYALLLALPALAAFGAALRFGRPRWH